MGYLRCEACGSKALSAASQCPRCAEPFELTDARGFRAPLMQCGGCGIMHRRDRACHWCGDRPRAAWRSPRVLSGAAAVALLSLVGTEAYRNRSTVRETFALITSRAFAPLPASDGVSAIVTTTASPRATLSAPEMNVPVSHASAAPDSIGAPPAIADGAMLASADSIQWMPAVARTWVNVHNDASRGGNVVGVINPSSRAMLGTTRAGWRQVKSPDVTGWVDPRLFETDSLRTRG